MEAALSHAVGNRAGAACARSDLFEKRGALMQSWSGFNDWACQHDVDDLLSELALAHVEGSATVAACARDDLLEKRRPIMQAWADCLSG